MQNQENYNRKIIFTKEESEKCYLCSTKGERIIPAKRGKTYIIKGKVSTSPKKIIRKCYLYYFVVKNIYLHKK